MHRNNVDSPFVGLGGLFEPFFSATLFPRPKASESALRLSAIALVFGIQKLEQLAEVRNPALVAQITFRYRPHTPLAQEFGNRDRDPAGQPNST